MIQRLTVLLMILLLPLITGPRQNRIQPKLIKQRLPVLLMIHLLPLRIGLRQNRIHPRHFLST